MNRTGPRVTAAALLLTVLAGCSGGGGLERYGGFTFVSPGGQSELTYPAAERGTIGDLSGPDLTSDGTINWNFFHNWDYDDSIAGGAFDYKSTAMHEVLHAMGFSSGINATGQGLDAATSGNPDVWYDFDRFLTNSTGTFLVNPGTFAFNTGLLGTLTGGLLGRSRPLP